jgi:hypothetical protein
MCVSIFKKYEKQKGGIYFRKMSFACIAILSQKCSLFDDYIIEESGKRFGNEKIKTIYEYFYNKLHT